MTCFFVATGEGLNMVETPASPRLFQNNCPLDLLIKDPKVLKTGLYGKKIPAVKGRFLQHLW